MIRHARFLIVGFILMSGAARAIDPIRKISSAAAKEDVYQIRRADALDLAANLQTTLGDAKLEKEKTGYRFTEIKKGGLFERLGFQVGDVILSIDGDKIESPADATAKIPELMLSDEFRFKIQRKNRKEVLTTVYRLVE